MHNHQVCTRVGAKLSQSASAVLIKLCFCVVAVGIYSPSAKREGLLCRADPGGGSRLEGQNRTVAYTGRLYCSVRQVAGVD